MASFVSSYIPTQASQVTRLADQVSILTSAFGYNAAAGTVAYEADSGAGGALAFVYEFSDGTSSERILSNAKAANHLYVVDGASVVDLDAGTFVTGVLAKASQAFEINNFAACINGGAVATSGAGTMPTVNILRFGRQFDTAWNLNGHIKRFTYFPTRRSNADLQVLST